MYRYLNWHKHGVPKRSLNEGTAPPGTPVWLSSRHHHEEPQGYEVFEVVPKVFRRWAHEHRASYVWACDAIRAKARSRSSYRSDGEWSLAEARKASRAATFDAFVLDQAGERLATARLHSHRLAIAGRKEFLRAGLGIPSLVDLFHSVAASLGIKKGREDEYVVRAVVDPEIEISLLQGSALFDHLVSLAETYEEAALTNTPFVDVLREVRATYFVDDEALVNGSINVVLKPDAPILVSVIAPDHEGARSAYALSVRDLEDGTEVVSDPLFVTQIGEDSIASDMPAELLPDAELSVLVAFDDVAFNLQSLSEQLQQPIDELWETLVAATQILGVEDVGDAARLAAASELVPVP